MFDSLSYVERCLFAEIAAGKKADELKSSYLKKYEITARHFNALRVQLEGKIRSTHERQKQQLIEKNYKIESVQKTVQQLEKKAPHSNKLHQKKRHLYHLKKKQEQ